MGINLQKLVDSNSASYSDLVEFITESGKSVWKGTMESAIDLSESYTLHKFVEPTGFNKAKMAIVVSPLCEEAEEKKQPKQRKYDLADKNKVLNAIKYFNYVKDDEEGYANAIIDGMHRHGVGVENISKDNRLLKYVDSCTADLTEEGHLSGSMTVEDIAKKHNVDVETINKQVEMGIKVEHEHTSDDDEAKRIALDHLYELPDYYTRLDKMEDEGEKALTENNKGKCQKCGRQLNDAGECPLCDLGDESVLDEGTLVEKPLYIVDEPGKNFGEREIKKPDGSSFKSIEEVEEYQDVSGKDNGHKLKTKDGSGLYTPGGYFIDSKDKPRRTAFFKHKQTGIFSTEKPAKEYNPPKD